MKVAVRFTLPGSISSEIEENADSFKNVKKQQKKAKKKCEATKISRSKFKR